MNYLKYYIKLIKKAETRENPPNKYERHHIFPKSIYGKNNRVVKLTPKEHYIAHALLYKGFVKRYGFKDAKTIKMAYAFRCMHIKTGDQGDRPFNSRLFERLRLDFLHRIGGENSPFSGKKHSEETKKKIREMKKGPNHPLYGKFGADHPSYGRVNSEESKQKMSEIKMGDKNPMRGKTHSKNVLEILRTKNLGKNNPSYGKKWFNNGEYSVMVKECPEGFKPGRLESRGQPFGENHPNYGKKWFNNGIKNCLSFKCPPGFKPGFIKKARNKNV